MADIKLKYGASGQVLTITLASLAHDAKRQSDQVSNVTNRFLDALVQILIATNAAADSTGDKSVYVYAYGSADAGINRSGNAGASDAAFGTDPQQLANCRLLGSVYAPTMNKVYACEPMTVAAAFGGVLPERWGIIVHNRTGQSLKASDSSAFYQGLLQSTS